MSSSRVLYLPLSLSAFLSASLRSYGSDGSTFLGGVLIDIDAAFRSARRHAVDEWFVLAPLRSAPSVTGDVRLRIQYVCGAVP